MPHPVPERVGGYGILCLGLFSSDHKQKQLDQRKLVELLDWIGFLQEVIILSMMIRRPALVSNSCPNEW